MNASKENCRKALEIAKEWTGKFGDTSDAEFVCKFLEAAHKKLPHEETYQKQKNRPPRVD